MSARLSFQLYSARHAALPDVMRGLARIGYAAVEGYPGVYDDVPGLRRLLDETGLTMPSGHVGLDQMEAAPHDVVRMARTLGMSTLIVPWLPEEQRPTSTAGWRKLGKRLNTLAQRMRAQGLALAWHNHDFECLRQKDGRRPIDVLFEAAPQLDWEIDVAWVARAKLNPVTFIKRHAAIITHAHVKDIARPGEHQDEEGWATIGTGTVNWAACLAALKSTRCMQWLVEHDNPKDALSFAAASFKNLNTLWEKHDGR